MESVLACNNKHCEVYGVPVMSEIVYEVSCKLCRHKLYFIHPKQMGANKKTSQTLKFRPSNIIRDKLFLVDPEAGPAGGISSPRCSDFRYLYIYLKYDLGRNYSIQVYVGTQLVPDFGAVSGQPNIERSGELEDMIGYINYILFLNHVGKIVQPIEQIKTMLGVE